MARTNEVPMMPDRGAAEKAPKPVKLGVVEGGGKAEKSTGEMLESLYREAFDIRYQLETGKGRKGNKKIEHTEERLDELKKNIAAIRGDLRKIPEPLTDTGDKETYGQLKKALVESANLIEQKQTEIAIKNVEATRRALGRFGEEEQLRALTRVSEKKERVPREAEEARRQALSDKLTVDVDTYKQSRQSLLPRFEALGVREEDIDGILQGTKSTSLKTKLVGAWNWLNDKASLQELIDEWNTTVAGKEEALKDQAKELLPGYNDTRFLARLRNSELEAESVLESAARAKARVKEYPMGISAPSRVEVGGGMGTAAVGTRGAMETLGRGPKTTREAAMAEAIANIDERVREQRMWIRALLTDAANLQKKETLTPGDMIAAKDLETNGLTLQETVDAIGADLKKNGEFVVAPPASLKWAIDSLNEVARIKNELKERYEKQRKDVEGETEMPEPPRAEAPAMTVQEEMWPLIENIHAKLEQTRNWYKDFQAHPEKYKSPMPLHRMKKMIDGFKSEIDNKRLTTNGIPAYDQYIDQAVADLEELNKLYSSAVETFEGRLKHIVPAFVPAVLPSRVYEEPKKAKKPAAEAVTEIPQPIAPRPAAPGARRAGPGEITERLPAVAMPIKETADEKRDKEINELKDRVRIELEKKMDASEAKAIVDAFENTSELTKGAFELPNVTDAIMKAYKYYDTLSLKQLEDENEANRAFGLISKEGGDQAVSRYIARRVRSGLELSQKVRQVEVLRDANEDVAILRGRGDMTKGVIVRINGDTVTVAFEGENKKVANRDVPINDFLKWQRRGRVKAAA